jgi:sugar phosphate isomerase/epimerase
MPMGPCYTVFSFLLLILTMPIRGVPVACCTLAVGFPGAASLPEKLEAIAHAGFDAVELGFPDLQEHARHIQGVRREGEGEGAETAADSWSSLGKAAEDLKNLVDNLGIKVLTIMPFGGYGGAFKDAKHSREAELERADRWFDLLDKLDGDILQVCHQLEPSLSFFYYISYLTNYT